MCFLPHSSAVDLTEFCTGYFNKACFLSLCTCYTGMSTAYEVITACHSDMTVFAFSLITNKCVTTYEDPKANAEEVLQVGKENEVILGPFVSRIIQHIDQQLRVI